MAKLTWLYMFVEPSADSEKHRAEVEIPGAVCYVVGVSNFEEGARIAQKFADDGGAIIELCGGFGYEGAARVNEAVGGRVPVGVITHQVWNYGAIAKALGGD
jgi:hypothetical protein